MYFLSCKEEEAAKFTFDEENVGVRLNDSSLHNETEANPNCHSEDLSLYESLNSSTLEEIKQLGKEAWVGVYIEVILVLVVIAITIILSFLLAQTRGHLSTATILFVFNILLSNALFVASFICLFSDFFDHLPYSNTSDENVNNAALIIAETLQTHLFASSEFFKHLLQETLFSLAQNGSLLGLTHLLVLVLLVINRSMSGKTIRLSKRCVVLVFCCVWSFLFVTHLIFSALQFSAITSLDQLFSTLSTGPSSLRCSSTIVSDFTEVGQRCDRAAVFHAFGVYLLRGHTIFTLTFLVASIVVFVVTMFCHWKVRAHNDIALRGLREQSPHRRREMLFHTLLLSLLCFFISVIGQTFVEIAVFWVDNRVGVAEIATHYQKTRILAFVDPLFNPILVALRIPIIRRRLRFYVYMVLHILAIVFCCPWKTMKKRSGAVRRAIPVRRTSSAATATAESANRTSESELTLTLLCTRQIMRGSLRRTPSSSTTKSNSVV
uniref:G-protein coupled receptors family 1 profile domain-containing protein n=1 Tax=Acrobeloides nanus TaxID=290746 RepID=A0A914CD23_9BILA